MNNLDPEVEEPNISQWESLDDDIIPGNCTKVFLSEPQLMHGPLLRAFGAVATWGGSQEGSVFIV
ncbi:hypothetical protein KaCgl_27250 [Corynebacterium glutamicum]|uniref:Uncharacterized protein n=1 Tax=Corynebacterium glutamicum (strain ATCC 13032 / DSM 20300 / JCM 1318 / BCRC 11384 / CCUG 27702 / LMG 3730 / NBRC 12168 / NCIMB 10025 / NRRL B-2784 / 534) TaxID=196627 RepID=Q8NRT4_CORGL|nr:hypothetical protein [Corynebacterium glutamicum]BAB98350.1 Hypothetical protein [Corynebacterium glutamicum ATCC 13032]BAV22780.1 hypothetical protein CGBL_0110430 [Corynebacterium glutamicum]BCB34751.1 hypothetical protein KaCgl_27250 [Corynebacterium glutamicum]